MSRTHTPLPDGLSYGEFFDFYLREHQKPSTRFIHYIGTVAGPLFLIAAIATGTWWLLPLGLVAGYAPAWFSHFFVERNKPAAFKYPLWSLISDFRMLGLQLTGRLNAALQQAGVDVPYSDANVRT